MSKKIIAIITIIIAIGLGIYLLQKEQPNEKRIESKGGGGKEEIIKEENVMGQIMAQTGPESATVYKYSLAIPLNWQGKYEIQEGNVQISSRKAEINNSFSFIYSVDSELKEPIFTIVAYPQSQWEILKTEPGYHGTEIVVKNETIFVYTLPLENPYELRDKEKADEFQTMVGDVQTIIKTFELK